MPYVDPAFEARRNSILGRGATAPQPSPTGGSLIDSSFQARRTQTLSQPVPQPTPVAPAPVQQQPPRQNIFDQIGSFISQKLSQFVPGGVKAGIERVKKTPATEYFFPTAKQAEPARQYIKDTLNTALQTIKGAGKLTPAYMTYRAAIGKPVSPKEYAITMGETGLNAIGFTWRMRPAAPLIGAGLNSWVGVRRYFEGKIDAREIIQYPLQGVTRQPGLGEVFTDNIKVAEAIDIVFLATMFAKPFVSKRLNQLNLKAQEINELKITLGVKPNASMREISDAFKAKMKQYPDTFTANPNPANLEIRKQLTNAYNALKDARAIDLKYAQAYEFIQSRIGNVDIQVKPFPVAPKRITAREPVEAPGVKAIVEQAPKYISAKDFAEAAVSAKPTDQIGTLDAKTITARDPIDPAQVEKVKGEIQSGKAVEPIEIIKEDGKFTTVDGSQRITAYQELGLPAPVIYRGEETTEGLQTFQQIYDTTVKPEGIARPKAPTVKIAKRFVVKEVEVEGLKRSRIFDTEENKFLGRFYRSNETSLLERDIKGLEFVTSAERVKPEGIEEPPTKIVLTKEGEKALDTVYEALTSGDTEGAQVLYDTFTKEDRLSLPAFDSLVSDAKKAQDTELAIVQDELKKEVTGDADDPTVILLGIADKLGKHFKSPGSLWKITGRARMYTTPEGNIKVGGDMASAFDKLIFATDIDGFRNNIRALHFKFDKVFTQIRDIIDAGDIDGADYEQFKQAFSEAISKRPVYRTGRRAISEGVTPKREQKAEVTRGEAPRPPQIKEPAAYGFNPKNLQDPQSPKAEKEVEKIIKKSEIAKELSEKLGVPIRRGKFNQRALGIFKTQPKVVRIKRGSLQTIFHEVGHFLDDQFKFSSDINLTERKALMTEYGYKYEGQSEKQRKEAFSEFLRFKMTGQDAKVEKFAPEFSKVFDVRMKELPDIKEVIDTATKDFKRWLDQPATAKILSHISIGTQNKISLVDKVNGTLHDLYTAGLDDLHPLSEFSRIAKKNLGAINARKDPYILARNLRGWAGKAELFLTRGTFGRNFWTVEKGKTKMNFTGKSYQEIMAPIDKAGKMDNFRVYIVAKRAIELADRGIVTGIVRSDAEEALKELSEKNPEFESISNERLAYKDALLKYAAEPSSGLLGPEGLEKIKALNKFHVPFYRVMEETAGGGFMGRRKMAGNLGTPIKRIKGSEREILDPLESDIKDTYAIINAVERNSIGVAMANLSTQNFELGRLFEKVDRPMKGIKVDVVEVLEKALKNTGLDIEDIPMELGEDVVTLFRPTQDRGPNMLNVNMGDKQMVFQVDPMLFKAIQGLNTEDVGLIMRILSLPSHILRAGATLTPDFSLRNPIRDQFSAFIYSRSGYIPGFDLIRGMFETLKKGDVYDLWKAGGGERAMLVSMDRKYLQKSLIELLHENKAKALKYVKNPLELLQAISEFGEQATRLGEMKRALGRGKNPVQAAFDSREVTLDFGRIGAKTKAVNLLIAFWNANVQGTDKLIRSFKNRPFQTLLKTLLGITLPSILLYFANRQDKRWKEIPGWQKDLFWIVFTKDTIWRIPKPFEVGILFGSVPERILEFMDTKDPKLFDQLQADVANGATPGFIPTTLLPVIENISNYSFFLDRPIVSRGKEGLPPEAQHGLYTTEIAKVIGSALRYSPAKIENLILGYTGGLGRYALGIIDRVLVGTRAVKIPPRPTPSFSDLPIIKAFLVREPEGSASESVNRIYTMYGEIGGQVTYVRKLVKDGDKEKARAFVREHPEIVHATTLNAAIDTFTEINRARDIILNSDYLNPDQKKQKIKKLNELQTKIAQKVLETVRKK